MSTSFDIITEEFHDDLINIRSLVARFSSTTSASPKIRLASVNANILLIAATFEEYIRQIAKASAKATTGRYNSETILTVRFIRQSIRRLSGHLSNKKLENSSDKLKVKEFTNDARLASNNLFDFLDGDYSKDIYDVVIHNENNMRPGELNGMFSIFGVTNMISKVSLSPCIQTHFMEKSANVCEGRVIKELEDFFKSRNDVAHSLNPSTSLSSDYILNFIELLHCVGLGITEHLNHIHK